MSNELQEREYFIRFFCLIMEVGRDIAQQTLDGICPPGNAPGSLMDVLSQPSTGLKMKNLLKRRVLSSLEYDRLYPTSGLSVSSEAFDISLLLKLLRNICSLPEPKNRWDNLPSPVDKTLSDDLARIKFYRNKLAHNEEIRLSEDDFNTFCKEVSEAFIRLGGTSIKIQIDKILSDSLSSFDYEAKKEIYLRYSEDLGWQNNCKGKLKIIAEMLKKMDEDQENKMLKILSEQKEIHQQQMQAVNKVSKTVSQSKDILSLGLLGVAAVGCGAAVIYTCNKLSEKNVSTPQINKPTPSLSIVEISDSKTWSGNKTSRKERDGEGKSLNVQQPVEVKPKIVHFSRPSTSSRGISESKKWNLTKTSLQETEIKGDDEEKYDNVQHIEKVERENIAGFVFKESRLSSAITNSKMWRQNQTIFGETEAKADGEEKVERKNIAGFVFKESRLSSAIPNSKMWSQNQTIFGEIEAKADGEADDMNNTAVLNVTKSSTSCREIFNSNKWSVTQTGLQETEKKVDDEEKYENVKQTEEDENNQEIENVSTPTTSKHDRKKWNLTKTSLQGTEIKGHDEEKYDNVQHTVEDVNIPKIADLSTTVRSRKEVSDSKAWSQNQSRIMEREIKGDGKRKSENEQQTDNNHVAISKDDLNFEEFESTLDSSLQKPSTPPSEAEGISSASILVNTLTKSVSQTPVTPESSERKMNSKPVKRKKTANDIYEIQYKVYEKKLKKQEKEIEKLNLQIEILKKFEEKHLST